MQVVVDVNICMQINFGGHGLFGFGDFGPFKIWPNFPFYSPWGLKIELIRISSK